MDMTVTFPGGARVDASFGNHVVRTDQPAPTGEGSAPTPFQMFLASIATCAGIYVLGFCRQRNLPTDGIRIEQSADRDPATGHYGMIRIHIHVPASFPEKYHEALIRSADQCLVKKHLADPPAFEVATVVD